MEQQPRRYVEPDGSDEIASIAKSTARGARSLYGAVLIGLVIVVSLAAILGLRRWLALQSR